MFGGCCCQKNKEILGTIDNRFSTLGDVTKNERFSHLYDWDRAEILSGETLDL